MKPEKKIFLNTSYQIIGKIITSILGVISFGLLAHYLNPLQMGQYNLILSFTGFLVMFADFGLVTLLIRDLANKTADESFTWHTFSLRLVLSLISMSAGSIIVFFFPYPLIVKVGVILYAFCNIFYLLSSIIGAVFQSRLQFEKIVIPQIVSSTITTALIAYAVWSKLPFLSFIAIAGSGFLINFLVSLKLFKQKINLKIDLAHYKKIIKQSWPFAIGTIVSVAYFKIDSLILPFFYNPAQSPDLGYYATAYKVFEVAIVFGGFYTQTLFPFFSANLASKDFKKQFNKFLLYTISLTTAGSITLFILARLFITILGGTEYLAAIPSLQILSLAAFISVLAGFFLSVAVAGNKQILLLKYAIAAVLLNILLNLLIIPKYSFIGASWTTVITQLFILFGNIYATSKVIKEKS